MSWMHWKNRMATKFANLKQLDYHLWDTMLGCYQKYTQKTVRHCQAEDYLAIDMK